MVAISLYVFVKKPVIYNHMTSKNPDTQEVLEAMQVFSSNMDEKLNKIDKRFDGMDKRFDGMDKRFDGMDKRFDGMDKRFDGIDERFDGMDKRFDGIDERLDRVESRLGVLESDMVSVKGDIASVKSQMVTKDYLDEKLSVFYADTQALIRKEDNKVTALIEILREQNVISSVHAQHILSMQPFSVG